MLAIETLNLTKYYGKSRGIRDVNLAVEEGEIYGFIGPNGSGKSTTIRTLLNFIRPTSGRCTIFERDCAAQTKRIKRDVGYLPSEVDYYDDMTVGELLAYSGQFYSGDHRRRIKELSDQFELDLTKKIYSLSLGNKKKTAIVQAVLHRPRLLILDEPTSGLDPLMQNRFFDLLSEEHQRGATIFFSSHVLSEVQRLCHRVAIVKDGQIRRVEKIEMLRGQTFRDVKVTFKRAIPALQSPGIKQLQTNGQTVSFLFDGPIQTLLAELARHEVADVWIEEPSLEQIFMHYYEEGEKP